MKTKRLKTKKYSEISSKLLAFQEGDASLKKPCSIFFCFKAVSIDENDRGTFVASELKTCLITIDEYYCYAEPRTRDFPSSLEVKLKEKQTLFALIPTLQGEGKKEGRKKQKEASELRSFHYCIAHNLIISLCRL